MEVWGKLCLKQKTHKKEPEKEFYIILIISFISFKQIQHINVCYALTLNIALFIHVYLLLF